MSLSESCQHLISADRLRAMPSNYGQGYTDSDQITIDHILVPSVELYGQRVLSQIVIDPIGLSVFGLTTINEAAINSAETIAGFKTIAGGLAGSISAGGDIKQAEAVTSSAIQAYADSVSPLQDKPLQARFEQAPVCAYYLKRNDVLEISLPKKQDEKATIKTIIGKMEFMFQPPEEQWNQILSWWEHTGSRNPNPTEAGTRVPPRCYRVSANAECTSYPWQRSRGVPSQESIRMRCKSLLERQLAIDNNCTLRQKPPLLTEKCGKRGWEFTM